MDNYLVSVLMLVLCVPALAFVVSFILTPVVRRRLAAANMLDRPNHRSNHKVPVPVGGGIAVMSVILFLWPASPYLMSWAEHRMHMQDLWPVWSGMLLLMMVSFVDDREPVSACWRLLAQMVAVGLGMVVVQEPLFGSLLPYWLDRLVVVLFWMWFINLFNFMDGADGMAGSTALIGSVLLWLLASQFVVDSRYLVFIGIIGASVAGFLWWNWQPAKIFLGDVGSVPLGYVLAFLMVKIGAQGMWPLVLAIPSYYLLDTTSTLLWRMMRGEKVWQAHSEHAFQAAIRSGWSHAQVVCWVVVQHLVVASLMIAGLLGLIAYWHVLLLSMVTALMLVVLFRSVR